MSSHPVILRCDHLSQCLQNLHHDEGGRIMKEEEEEEDCLPTAAEKMTNLVENYTE
jgi:hypothetical protein